MAINAQKRVTRRCLPNPNKRPLLALTITRSIVRRCARGWGYHNIATHGNFNCKVRHNESQIHKVWVHVGGGKNDEDAFDLALERTSARTQEGLGRHADILYTADHRCCTSFFSASASFHWSCCGCRAQAGLQSMHQHIHCGCCVIDAASRSRRSSCATPLCTFWVTESTIVLWNWINRGVI